MFVEGDDIYKFINTVNKEKMKFTWNQILILYVLIGAIVCNFLPIPELVKGVIATPAFLIVPYLFGHIILTGLKKSINLSLSKTSYIFVSFAVGFIFIPIIAFLLHTFNLFNAVVYSFFILLIFLVYFVKSKRYDKIAEVKEINITANVVLFLFTWLFAILFVYAYQPFPFILNVDIPSFQIPVTYLLKDYDFFVYLSNYEPMIHVIVTILSILFQADVYTLWWCCNLILAPFLALFGLYILSFKIFHDKRIYIIAFLPLIFAFQGAIYSIFPHSFILILFTFIIYIIEKEFIPIYSKIKLKNLLISSILFLFISFLLFYYLHPFLPYTLIWLIGYQNAGIGIFLLFFVIFFLPILLKKRIQILPENFKILFLMTIIMLLLYGAHIQMALLIFPFVLLYLILRYLSEKNYTIVRSSCMSLLLIFLIIFSLQYYDVYNFEIIYDKESILKERWNAPEFPVRAEIFISEFWTYTVFSFLLIGILFGTFDNKYRKIFPPLIIIMLGLFAFYLFVRVIAGNRALEFANPIASMFIAFGIIKISSFNLYKKNKIKVVIITVCMVLFISNVIYPLYAHTEKRIMECHGNPGMVTIEEYKAGKWMQSHLTKNTVIISDPLTSKCVGSSSELRYINMFLPSNISKEINSLFFNTLSLPYAHEMHPILTDVITWQNITTDYGVPEYPKKSLVIVVSKRTILWLKKDPTWCASTDHPLTEENIKPFLNTTYFTLLYNDSNKLYIFGVNPKPEIMYEIQNGK